MPLSRDIVAGLARRLAERAGLDPPVWVVESRAQARMTVLGLAPADYLELVSAGRGDAELGELIEAVRVGETRFFRHRSQVDALVDVIAPAIAARGRRPITVWSAGCASGEEPYTLAIVLTRALPEHTVSIIATDVSEDALAVAARATYPVAALDHVPEAWRDAFLVDGGEVRVRPELARRVTFERGNLVDGGPRGCALVWCRNVLIYFAPDARRRAVEVLVGALEPGGFLCVGYSETLRDVTELDPVRAGESTMYVKRAPGLPRSPRWTPPSGVPLSPGVPLPPPDHTLPEPTPPRQLPAASGPIAAPASPPAAPRSAAVTSVDREHALRVTGDCDPAALTRELGVALASPGLRRLTIDLDGADFVPDEVATILRRARAAAAAAGVALELQATRAGARRWLRRHGLDEGAP